jgi:hypothetical protein
LWQGHVFAVVLKLATGRQVAFVELHAVPAAQHLRLNPVPQGARPAGQPQMLFALSAQLTPATQHAVPHAV